MSHRYGLTSDNKGATDQALDFPKLSLKRGEVARLAIFSITEVDGKKSLALPEPEGGYFWSIRKPDDTFGGAFECLAPEETKKADEFDGDACPHCAAVLEGAPEAIIEPRRRRFVMPVIRYKTAPGKSTLTTPYSVECVAWVFSDRYFNTLVDEHEKWGESGGLLGHDISLLCEVEQYQNYKVSVEPQAGWRQDKALADLVFGTYASGVEMAPTLRRKLGQTLSVDQMKAKVTEALRLAGMIDQGELPQADAGAIEGLADELFGPSGAIPDAAVAEAVAEAPQEAAVAVETPDLGDAASSAPAAAEAAPGAAEEASGDGAADEIDFDDFFSK